VDAVVSLSGAGSLRLVADGEASPPAPLAAARGTAAGPAALLARRR